MLSISAAGVQGSTIPQISAARRLPALCRNPDRRRSYSPMPTSNIIKPILFLVIFSIASLARAADDASSSFITASFVRCWEDGGGNTSDDIVVSNTHTSKAIRTSVQSISVPRQVATDVD